MRIEGFRETMQSIREDAVLRLFPGYTKPEATALAAGMALDRAFDLLKAGKKAQEVFGISYSQFLNEYNRRKELIESSKAMNSVVQRKNG